MRKRLVMTLFAVLALSAALGAQETAVSRVVRVTVYGDRALVTRRAEVSLFKGESTVRIPLRAEERGPMVEPGVRSARTANFWQGTAASSQQARNRASDSASVAYLKLALALTAGPPFRTGE